MWGCYEQTNATSSTTAKYPAVAMTAVILFSAAFRGALQSFP
jgi:hypothetical protein